MPVAGSRRFWQAEDPEQEWWLEGEEQRYVNRESGRMACIRYDIRMCKYMIEIYHRKGARVDQAWHVDPLRARGHAVFRVRYGYWNGD